ncbi:uncharacterized protein LOC136093738 [Hydra vulgaris]|uniref:uncharacterized protein LOC136093738 n=1 Tax=Hydra vulgaris TaxID=6087 RepID=UPI0032E9E71D
MGEKELNVTNTNITLCAYNCQSFKSNSYYISKLLKSFDIIFISEHWLLNIESFLLNNIALLTHKVFFHAAEKNTHGRPYGGNAFMVRKKLSSFYIIHEDENILAIKGTLNNRNLIFIGVYLSSCRNNNESYAKYSSQLQTITSIMNNYEDEGECIISGDFQSFPYKIYDSELCKNKTRNNFSKHLTNFIESNQLAFVDIINGAGPTYTYQHKTLSNSSYIDHIASYKQTELCFTNCQVMQSSPLNLSDHLPVSTNINFEGTGLSHEINNIMQKYNSIPKHAWNNERFIDFYNLNLSKAFTSYAFKEDKIEEEIQKTCLYIKNAALLAVKQCFGQKEFYKYSKPWWTPELKKIKDNLSFHFRQWQKSGYNKSTECISYKRFIYSRKNFRKAVKAAHNKKIHEKTKNIEHLRNTNPQRFWGNIRKIKKNTNNRLFTINKLQNKNEIVEEFSHHFQKLLNTPQYTNNEFNPLQIPHLSKEPNSKVISTADIEKCILKLKNNKSYDCYEISAEHLKNSHNKNLLILLSSFYNNMLTNGKVPHGLSTAKIIPLVKSYKTSLENPNNYRGISIIPIFTKLLEYLIIHICPDITESHSHQFGFKENSSTLHAEFLLSETIKHYNHNNSPLYICSLDANKAFDSCNWELLFEKLYYQKKIPLSIVHTILSLYQTGTSNISYLGCTSNKFRVSQGVRQGSILSPHLYNIYTENLLEKIVSESKVGTSINGVYTGIIAYADDIVLQSSTISGLQSLINIVQKYGLSNFIKLNTEKTEFLISGISSILINVIYINGDPIKPQNNLKHLGFLWDNKNKKMTATLQKQNITERVTQFLSVAKGLIRNGLRFCQPATIVHLFNSLAVPTLLYGLELCGSNNKFLNSIDIAGRSVLKSFFNISKQSRNYLHSYFKVDAVSDILFRNKLNLFIRLLNNPICYSIIRTQMPLMNQRSFVGEVMIMCKKADINMLQFMIEGKKIIIARPQEALEANVAAILKQSFQHWNLKEQREVFRTLMEENIPRTMQENT